MSGWTVLDHLKHDPATRHIPVHVISGSDTARDGFALGAMTCVRKGVGPDDVLDQIFPRVRRSIATGIEEAAGGGWLGSHAQGDLRVPVDSRSGLLVQASRRSAAMDMLASAAAWMESCWIGRFPNGGDVEFIEEIQTRLDAVVPPVIVFGSRATRSAAGGAICTGAAGSARSAMCRRSSGCWMRR